MNSSRDVRHLVAFTLAITEDVTLLAQLLQLKRGLFNIIRLLPLLHA